MAPKSNDKLKYNNHLQVLAESLISTIRRCWTLRGHEVRVPYKAEYKWGYVYGALEFVTGDAEFVYILCISGMQLSLSGAIGGN